MALAIRFFKKGLTEAREEIPIEQREGYSDNYLQAVMKEKFIEFASGTISSLQLPLLTSIYRILNVSKEHRQK
jgi:hypothetical protein